MAHLVGSDIPEAHLAVPATRIDHVWIISAKLTGEDFVGMGRFEHPVADLLNKSQSGLVIDLDVGLRASNTEAAHGIRTVDGVVRIIFVQADMLH